MQLSMQLAMLKMQELSAMNYFSRVKGITNNLAAAKEPLHNDEIIAYLLTGLPEQYDSLVTSVTTHTEPISLSDVYTNLLSFEMRLIQRQAHPTSHPLTNYAARGGRGGQSGARSGGRHGGRGGGRTTDRSNGPSDRPHCQICGHTNNLAPQCWYRYDDGYQKDDKPSAAMASMPSYSVEVPWYSDTGATDHITNDLERLAIREKYQGKEQIQTVGGSGMPIRHVGHSMIQTLARALDL
jgi:hypothetical protein